MEIIVDQKFNEVDEEQFHYLMGYINIRRLGFCGGEYYVAWQYGDRRVGTHAYGKYYIDPKFFKPIYHGPST